MNRETTSIDLPPRRAVKSRPPRVPPWVWMVMVLVALSLGAGAGLWMGKEKAVEPDTIEEAAPGNSEQVNQKIKEARAAIADGNWLEARRLFEAVKIMDPKNADAIASLPLIDRRLDEARGSIRVETVPDGAEIIVEGSGTYESPVTIHQLPMGRHRVSIFKNGFEHVEREIELTGEETVALATIRLKKTAGNLEVVSEPKGAEFKLLKTIENNQKKLVEIGSTPALIERLDPGDYEILMAVEGWPEYSERVRVENNRNTSVSAVFARGGLQVKSDPSGAEVWIKSEGREQEKVGVTPLNLEELPVGQHRLELRYRDWEPIARTVDVSLGVTEVFDFSWERALVSFESDPSGAAVFLNGKRLGNGREVTPFQLELPEGDYVFSATHEILGESRIGQYIDDEKGTNVVHFPYEFGSVTLTSEPPGAAVLSRGLPIGKTPLTLPVVAPGSYAYELRKERYRSSEVNGNLEAGGVLNVAATLIYDATPVASRNFTNGLGQQLVWIGRLGGWVASHETTQAQYEQVTGTNPSYFPASNHPVDSVNWYEATKFCEGLTVREQSLGNLPEGFRYRLPTDLEWSAYVGVQKLDGAISSLFDRKKSTAPVGTLAPNEYGIYDARGNVWEWVSDWYSQTIVNRIRKEGATPVTEWIGTDRKVLRGGAWNRSSQFDLEVANRMAARPSAEDRYDVGFRVVLMPSE
ncbi:MAG: PEGA domain-containing protein [Verrucomicrobiales bacterium]|nr:PEGA domain-containing protein [Verrucomicrobiales bacterium]